MNDGPAIEKLANEMKDKKYDEHMLECVRFEIVEKLRPLSFILFIM